MDRSNYGRTARIVRRASEDSRATKKIKIRILDKMLHSFRCGHVVGIMLLTLIGSYLRAAEVSTLVQVSQNEQWLQDQLPNHSVEPPFSFTYNRQSSKTLLASWPKETKTTQLSENRAEHTTVWTDPRTHLEIRLSATSYADSPVIEWTVYFANRGDRDTPILEDIEALDTSVLLPPKNIPIVFYSRGCGGMDTYSLQKQPLNQLASFRLSNKGGGKTGETIPFFDIVSKDQGMIGAVGWPGKWSISFSRPTQAAVAVQAGMEKTHLLLHPGEQIRTPQILILSWRGDVLDAHNALRRHILKYRTPHYAGVPVELPISNLGWGGMKTSTSLRLLKQISDEKIGYENFWMDAGWYGADRAVDEFQIFGQEDWFLYAGNWNINRVPHPDGLKPISDAAHTAGMKFLLWFEPERGVEGTPLVTEHPDWFIGEESANFEGNVDRPLVKFRLFNFGNPVARQFMIDSMSKRITDEGIDIFRQDCNFALAQFWAQEDTRDRQGLTEIRYVEGLLEFWDQLRQRHPQLILDIVQRGDLESISRGVDLSRADYPVSPDADPIGNQVSTEGLAYWRPHYGTILQVRPQDTYHFRSGSSPGLAFALFNVAGTKEEVGSFIPPNFPYDWLRTMVSQLKQVRPYYYGDYYPILPCSSNADCTTETDKEQSAGFEWAAWQFNRPEQGDGMIQAFRRDGSNVAAKDLRLRGIDPGAKYEITDLDANGPIIVSGETLVKQGLHVKIAMRPGAAIILYKKVK
jgi:alpha-galactosidase